MTQTTLARPDTPSGHPTPDTWIARTGRWCFRHRWTVLGIWLVAIVLGGLCAGPVFQALNGDEGPSSLESVQGGNVLNAADTSGGSLVAVVRGIDPQSTAVRRSVTAAAAKLSQIPGVEAALTPYTAGASPAQAAAYVAKDQHGLLIEAKLADRTGDAYDTLSDAVVAQLRAVGPSLAAAGVTGATVEVGGGELVNEQANDQAQTDLSRAEELSLPITLVILVLVFGGIIAASVPVLGAIVSIVGSFGILLVFSKLTTLDQNAVTVISLLGLGLSVDYGLLLVARYRDELAAGHPPQEAVGRAWASAGRTIVFSALTVAAALCGMLVFGITALSALGAAGVSITLMAMLVAMTFTAALLGLAGRRIKPSRRAAARAAADGSTEEGGFFGGLARIVQRRPLVTALVTGGVLIAAGLPLLSMTVHVNDLDGLPRSLESVRVIDVLSDQFGQAPSPAVTVVARTDAASLDHWAQAFDGSPDVAKLHPAVQVAPGLSMVDIDAVGPPEGDAALRLVDATRADRPAGVQSWVTGTAAVHRDLIGLIRHRLPYALALTFGAMIVLLFAMTGSAIAPLKALLMNVVSLGATFGVLSAVFEHGVLAGLLHTTTVSGLSPFVLVTVVAFAFGLSMDYEVFLLARIKEQVDRGLSNDAAVRQGLQRSGRIITSAALLMVIVFSCFVIGRIGNVQQIGLGLAVAVAIDATLVRCVLVPATMTLLGRWNWWAPPPLAALHRRLGLAKAFEENEPRELSPAPA
jgi:putative drug exporter of the RND superfamily